MANEIVVQQHEVNPLAILQQAVARGSTVEELTALMGLAERFEANQAKKDYRESMAEFSRTPITIPKNNHVKFATSKGVTEYDHSTLDKVTDMIVAGLSKVGVTHAFRVHQQASTITVTCILSKGVHSEETSLSAQADESGGKNSIQAVISTVTYLRRHTLLAATGVATGTIDDDGAGGKEAARDNVLSDIATAKTLDELTAMFNRAYKLAAKRPDDQKAFKEAAAKRKAELVSDASH